MVTKLVAAELAAAAGCQTYILRGSHPENIVRITEHLHHQLASPLESRTCAPDDVKCTRFQARHAPLQDRNWWILHGLYAAGTVYVDLGAAQAIAGRHKSSLFAVGITKVDGNFAAQQCVKIVLSSSDNGNQDVLELGRGLVNYSSEEIQRIKGIRTKEMEHVLGYVDAECVIHRDNLVRTISAEAWESYQHKKGMQ